jgi:acetylornithine deacetylase/succinyl-diaminopimelate desuccinylase-like protein
MDAPVDDARVIELTRTLVRAASPSGRERPAVEAFAAALRDLGCDRVEIDGVGNAVGHWVRGEGPSCTSTATSTRSRRATRAPGPSTRWPAN